jgi:glycosyltransferase involved in cell wall biosynthesis
MKRPQILMLGQYPLDKLDAAPKIRTYHLWQALEKYAEVTFLTGTRQSRRWPLLKLILAGNLKRFEAVYLEAATSTSMEIDFLLLVLLKLAGIPIGIYIRDAYPLFGLTLVRNPKEWLLNKSWFISQWAYQRLADILFFPTQSLADCFDFKAKELLPPATRMGLVSEVSSGPFDTLLYAGHLSDENGWPLLKATMDIIHTKNPQIRLLALTPTVTSEQYPWLEIRRGVLDDVLADLPRIAAALIPRPLTDYNHLAIPVKLMDYLSLGLPIVSTDCKEMAKLINEHDLGRVVSFEPEDFALTCLDIFDDSGQRTTFSQQSMNFIQVNRWEDRAEVILTTLLKSI